MSGGDWLRPDWFRTAMRAWTPAAAMPPSMATALRQVVDQFGLAPAIVSKQLIDTATSRLVGRNVTLHGDDGDVTLVLRLVRLVHPPVGLMIGQVGDIEIEAEDVTTSALRIRRLTLAARNLHIQPGATTTLVAAPIRLRAFVDAATVAEAVAARTRRVEIELGADGTARAYLIGRRTWGHVELAIRVERRALVLAPTAVVVRGSDRLSSLARRLPPLRLALPELAAGLHIGDVAVEDGQLVVDAVYEEWRREVTPSDVEQLLRRIERFDGGVLDVRQAPA